MMVDKQSLMMISPNDKYFHKQAFSLVAAFRWEHIIWARKPPRVLNKKYNFLEGRTVSYAETIYLNFYVNGRKRDASGL